MNTWNNKEVKPPVQLNMTRDEAAKSLGICVRTLDAYTKKGEIPFIRVGSRVLYPVASLQKWIDGQLEKSA